MRDGEAGEVGGEAGGDGAELEKGFLCDCTYSMVSGDEGGGGGGPMGGCATTYRRSRRSGGRRRWFVFRFQR